MEDLKGFKKSLEALDRRFEEWIAPINEVEQSTMFKVNKDGYTLADAKREVDEVVRKQLSQYDPYPEMYSLIDSLCGFYLETSPKNRARIRRTVRDKNGVWSALINYIYWAAAHLASPSDDKWLCQGLAAVSIEDCNFDYRDTLMAVAELDPQPFFNEAAGVSSSKVPRGGSGPVSDMLNNFQRYAVLSERRRKPGLATSPPWKKRVYFAGSVPAGTPAGKTGTDPERSSWWASLWKALRDRPK
jgi:hypothetical protein